MALVHELFDTPSYVCVMGQRKVAKLRGVCTNRKWLIFHRVSKSAARIHWDKVICRDSSFTCQTCLINMSLFSFLLFWRVILILQGCQSIPSIVLISRHKPGCTLLIFFPSNSSLRPAQWEFQTELPYSRSG